MILFLCECSYSECSYFDVLPEGPKRPRNGHCRRRSGTLTAGASVVGPVPEDASLDQFASPEPADSEDEEATTEDAEIEAVETEEADAGADSEDAGAETEADADSTSLDASAVEPAVSTYRWSSDGGECPDCGSSAERLWRGDGQKSGDLVCADCKEW